MLCETMRSRPTAGMGRLEDGLQGLRDQGKALAPDYSYTISGQRASPAPNGPPWECMTFLATDDKWLHNPNNGVA